MKNLLSGIDLIVGIPSYMERDSISFVTRQADLGLTKYFGHFKSIIINADNNSEDDTRGAFLSTKTKTPKRYIATSKGTRGKGNNLLNIFRFAKKQTRTLKGAAVVDADLRSITPEWIKYLVEPILKGYDYVLPIYSRHQFDGTITNHICYPLVYGLLGENFRQPIGGETAFSPALMNYWLDQKWDSTTRHYGIDIFMTLHAIFGHFKICEAGLGAKIHKASSPKLGPMFTEVVTTLFEIILSRESSWTKTAVLKPESKKRFGLKRLVPPQELKIDIRELKEKLRAEYYPKKNYLKKYLNDYAATNLEKMFEQDVYNIDAFMWTQILYQLIFSYRNGATRVRKDIVEAIKPLYFARSVTFDYQTWRYSVKYVEDAILEQAKAFASQKPYFFGLYLSTMKKRAAK
jgi:glycosyltransferase involved in cell wall biosynthesis